MTSAAAVQVPQFSFRNVDELVPYANNARTHSEAQVAQIAASIAEFGFNAPVLIDGANGIIAGHGRVMAAKKLGLVQVPVIELSHMTEAQKRAYIIADNKIALNAGWDEEKLAAEIAALSDVGVINIETLGFSEDEVASLLAGHGDDAPTAKKPPAQFPSYDEKIQTEHQCPKCGYRWSGKSQATDDE
jgi:ParB-like chromosome segregation protein Spo0J